jgi:hypothetical protein
MFDMYLQLRARSIVALGYGWHTLEDREQTLQFTDADPLFKKNG